MSALRLGRRPDGTRDIVILDDGAVGRVTHSRVGIRGGSVSGVIAVGGSGKVRYRDRRKGAHLRLDALTTVRTNPDNGAVKAATTEVHR